MNYIGKQNKLFITKKFKGDTRIESTWVMSDMKSEPSFSTVNEEALQSQSKTDRYFKSKQREKV